MKDKKLKNIRLKLTFSNEFYNIENTGFVKGRAKIAYAGSNRNQTNIPREAFEKAMTSLALTPVVGNWIGEKNNFGGHDVAYEEVGNDVVEIDRTVPFGVVPQNYNPEWTDVDDGNGNIKRYFTCDIIFWKEKYPIPVQKIIDGGVGQSMEIVPTTANWNDETNLFDIDEFYYLALCLLGRDETNPENTVEPCFENSEITVSQFSMQKDKFKSEFAEMMLELKQSFSLENEASESVEGGDKMSEENKDEITDLEAKLDEAATDVVNETEIVETEAETKDDTKVEEVETVEDETIETTESELTEAYDLEGASGAVAKAEESRLQVDIDSARGLVDELEPSEEKNALSERLSNIEVATEEEVEIEDDEDYKLKYSELLVKFNEMTESINTLNTEIINLREFKSIKDQEAVEVEEARVREVKTAYINENYSNLKEDVRDMFISKVDEYASVEDIDADICVYIVKNKVTFARASKEASTVKVNVVQDKKERIMSPYGDLFEK